MSKNKIIKIALCMALVITFVLVSSSCTLTKKSTKINLTISVASSLSNAMREVCKQYQLKNKNVVLTINYGSSGSLQEQIEQGAPVDLFISAGEKQMNSLSSKALLLSGTRKDLLNNDLVLIAPNNSKLTGFDSLSSSAVSKIAIGDKATVPAGQYAAQVLDYYKLSNKISRKLVYGQDVETVLSWVVSGNVDAGLVYKTDALSNNKVKIISEAPPTSHDPINYPIAVVGDSQNKSAAKIFEKFLFTNTAQTIFNKYGFASVK